MAVGILGLTSESGFSASMSLRDKRRVHTVLQVIGAALALAGSFIMSLDKNVNFNTLHGKFGKWPKHNISLNRVIPATLSVPIRTNLCLIDHLNYSFQRW